MCFGGALFLCLCPVSLVREGFRRRGSPSFPHRADFSSLMFESYPMKGTIAPTPALDRHYLPHPTSPPFRRRRFFLFGKDPFPALQRFQNLPGPVKGTRNGWKAILKEFLGFFRFCRHLVTGFRPSSFLPPIGTHFSRSYKVEKKLNGKKA